MGLAHFQVEPGRKGSLGTREPSDDENSHERSEELEKISRDGSPRERRSNSRHWDSVVQMDEQICFVDAEATVCICDPPCGSVCAFPGCSEYATKMVPGELVFGFENGEIMNPVWGNQFDDLLRSGGWDTWVCDGHNL